MNSSTAVVMSDIAPMPKPTSEKSAKRSPRSAPASVGWVLKSLRSLSAKMPSTLPAITPAAPKLAVMAIAARRLALGVVVHSLEQAGRLESEAARE